jgi:hypothetical protein
MSAYRIHYTQRREKQREGKSHMWYFMTAQGDLPLHAVSDVRPQAASTI